MWIPTPASGSLPLPVAPAPGEPDTSDLCEHLDSCAHTPAPMHTVKIIKINLFLKVLRIGRRTNEERSGKSSWTGPLSSDRSKTRER